MSGYAVVFILVSLVCTAAEIQDGTHGRSLYRLVRPENWNGRLVVYAHGQVSRKDPVMLPTEADLITGLLVPQGIAVAFSSFSENGWAIGDGTDKTRQLISTFAKKFGKPTKTYAVGTSMGGLIAIKLVEKDPGLFAGALAICPASGGTKKFFYYAAHVRAVFDAVYPGVLPGTAAYVNTTVDVLEKAIAAMTLDPSGALVIAAVDQTPVPYSTPTESETAFVEGPSMGGLLQSIAAALVVNAGASVELLPFTKGSYFDNHKTVYTSSLLPEVKLDALNREVKRFRASKRALWQMKKYYEPSGNLRLPMLALSVSRDPVVPAFHEVIYAAKVKRSDYFVQRQVTGYGHCNFSPLQLATAFTDLVSWAEAGVRPAA